MFVALLDEYENLFPYQQRIVNGLVKLAPPIISFKIARKLGTAEHSGTTTGQELQETHDYARVPLEYDVEDSDERRAYHELLRHIVLNILRSDGLPVVDVDRLLPDDKSVEVDEALVVREVAKLCKVTPDEFAAWSDSRRREKLTYYREVAVYRILLGTKGRRAEKRIAGFMQLAFVSSGVIRYFQEILGVAYHLTYGALEAPSGGLVLPVKEQTKAVHFVSQHNLTTLSRNVERYGETLKYFVLDLGDCLRHKLLWHTSEPEAARITIQDPERLEKAEMADLKCILMVGTREGVFQIKQGRPAFRPKHRSDPQPAEFNISRIYAPVLEISPRLRWRSRVACRDLLALLQPGERSRALKRIKEAMVRADQSGGNVVPALFGG
jgi:hypothetical protein